MRSKRGASTVELALTLPMLLVVTFGMAEVCNLLHLRQRALTVAHEGVRFATRPTTAVQKAATAEPVKARCVAHLAQLQIVNGTATVTPANLTGIAPGTPVKVDVSVPLAGNSLSSFVIPAQGSIDVSASMVFE